MRSKTTIARRRLPAPWGRVALLVLLAVLTIPLRDRIAARAPLEGSAPRALERAAPGESLAAALLPGGLRALALAAVWIRADRSLEEGRFWDLLADYRIITLLDPENETAWELMSHQLAYTVSLSQPDPELRLLWIREGISMAEMGLRRLPGSSRISAQIGVIYLERCSGDPWIRQAFERAHGQSPIQSALDFFVRARDAEGVPTRWDPYIVLCLDLLAREHLRGDDLDAAESCLVRAREHLVRMRRADPDAFDGDEGTRWLDRVDAWLGIVETLGRINAHRAAGRDAEARKARVEAVEALRRYREEHPEDSSAESWIDQLENW